jgi:hypothetical protein
MNFELQKNDYSVAVETHPDGEIWLGCESPISKDFDDDGTGHGCGSGMWLTRAEAIQVRDALTVALFVVDRKTAP